MRCDNECIVAGTPPQLPIFRRWFLRSSLVLAAILIALALASWKTVLRECGELLVSDPAPQRADLILVLAGDFYGQRVLKGADLGVEGYAPVVLISSAPYQDRTEGLAAIDFLTARGYPRGLFQIFDHHAASTITEALALRPELSRRGVKRVLLVTSAYHSRRASIVFGLFCPRIRFITIGAPAKEYQPDHWWDDPHSQRLFFAEWGKILGTVLFEYPKYAVESVLPQSSD
jgi:uncharacterized SAM-binding protein YcdF (DUF218 family)